MGPNAARQAAQIEQGAIDTNARRRIHRGTKAADMAAGPPLVPLHEVSSASWIFFSTSPPLVFVHASVPCGHYADFTMGEQLDSAFQLQEHLAALHYHHTVSRTSPITRDTAALLATPPAGVDKTLWLYELCRFLISQCNDLIVGFLFDTPPCSAQTCPEMRASEWQFLCAVHDAPKSCCAIDYCCHTLDWAANVVTNPKIFPSRFVLDAHDKNIAIKNLVNVFRRLHRIFAHAWFQHRGVFWSVEGQTGLYVFFKTVCDIYDLLPAENYKLPPEAEGLDSLAGNGAGDGSSDRRHQQQQPPAPISIAKPPSQRVDFEDPSISRTNTRRHIKSSPSTGSAVTTVPEADEDDSADLSSRLNHMRISAAPVAAADEELELASIPVIVEHRTVASGEQPARPSSVIPPSSTVGGGEPAVESESAPVVSMQGPEATGSEPGSDVASKPDSHAGFVLEPGPGSEPRAEPQPVLNVDEKQPAPPAKTQELAEQGADNSAEVDERRETQLQEAASASETATNEMGDDQNAGKAADNMNSIRSAAAAEKTPGEQKESVQNAAEESLPKEAGPAEAKGDDGQEEKEPGKEETEGKATD